MTTKKKIPCRVCGKLFEPCAYCQSHSDVFRWRNFACSIECARKYVNDTIFYRESLKTKDVEADNDAEVIVGESTAENSITTRKKTSKKNSANIVENENKDTE